MSKDKTTSRMLISGMITAGGILLFIFGLTLGLSLGEDNALDIFRKECVEAGIAEYFVDSDFNRKFRFKD